MKINKECPVCGKKPFFTLKGKIYIEKYRGVMRKVAAEYFKLGNESEPQEVVSFCSNCRAIYRAKFFDVSEIETIYSSAYRSLEEKLSGDPDFGYDNEKFLNGCSEKMLSIVHEIEIKNNIKVSNIFDIGGRDGFRLRALADEGYNCAVFDPISCEVCDKRIRKEHIWSHEIKKDEKADIIFLCNVLEHSIDPYRMIQDCYAHLREGGFLYIELPSDIETVFDWILFNIWRKANLTTDHTHYVFYSKRSVVYLLESIGFSCIRCNFSLLPITKVNVLETVGQKKRFVASRLSRRLSFDYDIVSSNHFPRLFSRLIRKIFMSVKAIIGH